MSDEKQERSVATDATEHDHGPATLRPWGDIVADRLKASGLGSLTEPPAPAAAPEPVDPDSVRGRLGRTTRYIPECLYCQAASRRAPRCREHGLVYAPEPAKPCPACGKFYCQCNTRDVAFAVSRGLTKDESEAYEEMLDAMFVGTPGEPPAPAAEASGEMSALIKKLDHLNRIAAARRWRFAVSSEERRLYEMELARCVNNLNKLEGK